MCGKKLEISGLFELKEPILPSCHLKNLVSLSLDHFQGYYDVGDLIMFIDLSKLKELKLIHNECVQRVLLRAACNLERLVVDPVHFIAADVSEDIDSWCATHGGVPPLRYLHIGGDAHITKDIVKSSLQRLNLEQVAYGAGNHGAGFTYASADVAELVEEKQLS
jgi:hypothetical protein|eukprot:4499463-Prymnesium_polylepis.2